MRSLPSDKHRPGGRSAGPGRVFADLTVSLDGYCAGPGAGPDNPLGDGGIRLHSWGTGLRAWRSRIGLVGGETGRDDDIVAARYARAGAYVVGRRLFDEGEAAWLDPPPFRAPVFVVTHRPREPWVRRGGTVFTFVEGLEAAIDQARDAAGGRDVNLAGGADVVRQALDGRFLDELELHVAPLTLGGGTRLLEDIGSPSPAMRLTRAEETPRILHLSFAAAAPELGIVRRMPSRPRQPESFPCARGSSYRRRAGCRSRGSRRGR